jgi:hypothetical protein
MSAAAEVKSVFGRALELSDPAARAAYLAEACGQNAALRAEVDALLAALDRAGGFLKHVPAADEGTGAFAPSAPATATFGAASAPEPTADYPTLLRNSPSIRNDCMPSRPDTEFDYWTGLRASDHIHQHSQVTHWRSIIP